MFFQQMSTQSGEGGKTISESISFPPFFPFRHTHSTVQYKHKYIEKAIYRMCV